MDKTLGGINLKGVLLAGGKGTRLGAVTRVTNKHLLPIYDKPMIEYPLQTLIQAGMKEILVVTGTEHMGAMITYLGSGKKYGVDFTYKVQDEAGGIAQALSLAENFATGEPMMAILGDNIFGRELDQLFKKAVEEFSKGAKIFLIETDDPERFGIAEVKGGKVVKIIEKPKKPPTNLAVTGLYMYDATIFDIIRTLKPSKRGELEITDVNNAYIKKGELKYARLKGWWSDAGTSETLFKSWSYVREQVHKSRK